MTRLRGAAARPLEFAEMIELRLGEPPRWHEGESCFDSEEDRRAAWEAHRERLKSRGQATIPGHRCWGWWRYEAEAEKPESCEEQILYVARRGDLEPRELAALEQESARAEARIASGHAVASDPEAAAFYGRVREALP